jgi:hypothetical protein
VYTGESANRRRVERELERVTEAGKNLQRATALSDLARQELREAILAASAKGASVRVIARAAGISPARVQQIVHGR